MKHAVSATVASKQAVKTPDLLYRDRRKLQNVTSCSGGSYICPVQGNLKYRTVYLHRINIEDSTLNTLFVGFRLTNFHQLIPMPVLRNISIYASAAADSSTL